MTLLARLFILVLLAVLPAIGIQVYSVLEQRSEREAEVTGQAERLLHRVETENVRIIDNARLMVTAIAEAPFLRGGDVSSCQTYLERLSSRSSEYRALSVTDAEGRILCSGDPSRVGGTLGAQPHFRRAMAQNRFVVGEWTITRSGAAGGELPVASPYADASGRQAGVVALSLDVPWLTAAFAAQPLPANATLTVADRAGTILVRLPGSNGRAGERLPDGYLPLLSGMEAGVTTVPGPDGTSRILAFSPAATGIRDLFISVGVDRGAAMGAVDRATRDGLLMSLLGFLVAAAAAWIGGTLFIRRPVDALVSAARDWSEGRTATRVKLSDRSSEIGQLGHAFDTMADRLEAREAALRQSERHIRAVLDALPAFVGVLTPDGAVSQVNRAAADAAGLPPARILGRPFDEICWLAASEAGDQAGREQLRNALAVGAAGRSSRFDVDLRMPDGQDLTVDVNLTPMVDPDGHVTHLIASGIDITERKRTEEALRVAEERVRTGLRNSGVVVFNQDRDLRYTWAHSEWLGVAPEALIGCTDTDLFDHGEDTDVMMALKRRVMESGIAAREEVCIRCKGEERFFDLTVDPLRDPAGRVEGVTCAAVDVTDRKRAEAELRRAREEADHANEGKSKFLAAASHDLRQPVQSLYLFTAALTDRLQGHQALPILDNIRQGLDTLKALLDGLLDMSRLESGKIVAAPVDVRLNLLLGRLVAEYGPRAAQKGLELRAVPTRAWVHTDPAHLERILRNLVENALRYTTKGKVLIGCRRTPSGLRVEVWDTGAGIPADRLEDIFEEFTQLGERSERGLGLGLAIVKRLSRLLGHPVTVRSWEGKGSAFAVELPRVILGAPRPANGTAAAAASLAQRSVANDRGPAAGAPAVGAAVSAVVGALAGRTAAKPPAPPPAAQPAAGKGMVLVIDDEAIVLLGLKAILEGWGYDVVTAKSGDQALERLRADGRCPEIMLADYQLQHGRTGPEALVAVQSMIGRTVPGIILTGDTTPERQQEAESKGFRILHKPVFPNDLRRMMASAGAA
ncbi:PAS domain-containing protein [Azospirillum picis]|uniref:histidine kinase n=1 Tax=Azospirillum picis TaxID=488438 RepID=A0ABU0MKB0_9PROT|nr:PAS domain-containing protein [Azospirillum picis]MBP2300251.1 PAS domain S-box-containing protein [Azospirillum picis]MDQ0533907.1 PAS domain S-box-containing protein [Azospirillum picis]